MYSSSIRVGALAAATAAALGLVFVFVAAPALAQTSDAPISTAVNDEEGEYLVAGNGYALYLFKADTQGTGGATAKSACEGDCLATWPPLLVEASPVGTGNVHPDLLGTMILADGTRQATYNGWPLYFYAHEGPGEVLCQNVDEFGGLWLVVRPNGTLVR